MKRNAIIIALTLPLLACTIGRAIAQESPKTKLQSAGTLEFGDKNVLFVGDSRAAVVHAFELRDSDLTSQENVDYGNGKNFLARDLISNVDEKLAAFLGTKVDQISINDLVVHRPTKQILMSVSRGLGPDAKPVIVKINKGKFEILELSAIPHSQLAIENAPTDAKLSFGQSQRSLTITDIAYWNGEIFVAGVSNEEFASKLRRAKYPFQSKFATTSVEIWHAVHAQFETRAPIVTQLIRKINGKDYLIAAYTCTPLVRIPLEDIKPNAKIRGTMIGELGYGNTPIDMITFKHAFDKQDYLLVTHNSRNGTRIALTDIPKAKPMPVNSPKNYGPAGIKQISVPVSGMLQTSKLDDNWAVVIRQHPNKAGRVDLRSMPLPLYFDRSEHIVEMNWPGYKRPAKQEKKDKK